LYLGRIRSKDRRVGALGSSHPRLSSEITQVAGKPSSNTHAIWLACSMILLYSLNLVKHRLLKTDLNGS
jgi:hypothetical protein